MLRAKYSLGDCDSTCGAVLSVATDREAKLEVASGEYNKMIDQKLRRLKDLRM